MGPHIAIVGCVATRGFLTTLNLALGIGAGLLLSLSTFVVEHKRISQSITDHRSQITEREIARERRERKRERGERERGRGKRERERETERKRERKRDRERNRERERKKEHKERN